MELLNLILQILMILGQFVAAVIVFLIYWKNELGGTLLTLFLAFLLMGLRRLTALVINIGWFEGFHGWVSVFDRVWLPFIITILIVLGMWKLWDTFDEMDRLERDVRKVVGDKLKRSGKGVRF
jgi:hypothetical protein